MLQRARQNTVVETIFLLVVAVALAVLLQAFAIKPYKIPSGSMEPTLHVARPRARQPVRQAGPRQRAEGRRHHGLPPAGRRRRPGRRLAVRRHRRGRGDADAVRQGDAEAVQAVVHQARGRRRRRHDRDPGRQGHPQRQDDQGAVRGAVRLRQRHLRLPEDHHGAQGLRVHDGRQPRQLRRLALLGPDPDVAG